MSALMRNLGGSVGISFITTLLARLAQKHLAMPGAFTVNGNGAFESLRELRQAHGRRAATPARMP